MTNTDKTFKDIKENAVTIEELLFSFFADFTTNYKDQYGELQFDSFHIMKYSDELKEQFQLQFDCFDFELEVDRFINTVLWKQFPGMFKKPRKTIV